MAFSSAWLDELLSKSDITEIISNYVDLKPKGRKLWGLCPFHGEKTPSFSVSPDKQLFYCFGCHVGGSVIQFIQQMEKLSYREAILFLADRAHIALPDQVSDEDYLKQKAYKDRLTRVNQNAARFFCEQLIGKQGASGREYANTRGLTKNIILRFGIGYAPDSWDSLKNYLTAQGFSEKEMIDAGVLVRNTDRNSTYDTYRNRLMFPIQNIAGAVIGFGGRVLDDSKPKYINTGDTAIYNKKNNLYALNLLKQEKLNDIIIVEGYMDVIGLYKAGIRNVVASLGTALTVQQARLLKRYASEIYIAYDGDYAGQNGMIRGLEILAEQGLSVHVIVFPENLDPDEYVHKYGKDSFYTLKSEAFTISGFKLERMADGINFNAEDQREQYALSACKYIRTLPPLLHERYLKIVADKTGYSMLALSKQVSSSPEKTDASHFSVYNQTANEEKEFNKTENRDQQMLIQACLQDSSVIDKVKEFSLEEIFSDSDYRDLFNAISYNKQTAASYISKCTPDKAQKISAILQSEYAFSNPNQIAMDCINKIQTELIDKQISALQMELANAKDGYDTELILQISELQKKKRGVKNHGKA